MSENRDQPGPVVRWPWVAGLVAAVAVLGVVGWVLWNGDDDSPADSAATTPTASATTDTPTTEPTSAGSSPTAVVPTDEPTAVATDPAGERREIDDVAPNETAKPARNVSIRIVRSENVRGKAVLPDDTAGPALRVTIRVDNDTRRLLDSRFAVVNAYYGKDRRPASQLSQPGGRNFPPSIAAGSSASAVYLFSIPRAQRDDVTIEVDLAPRLPVSHFVGSFG